MAIDANYNEHKLKAVVTGVFFITATVTAIIGLKLYDPILQNPDFLSAGARSANQVTLGAVFELILALANVGTGVMLYPYLRKFSESWGLGYVCFRFLEVVFIILGIVSVLTILSISHDYVNATGENLSSLQALGKTFKTIHGWAFILGPHFMLGINTFIYSIIFYQSGLVPRKLSVFGIIGAVLILMAALLEMFGIITHFSIQTVFMALPIATYEMVLASRLIIKGFNLEYINASKSN
jgi:hypothetical protein